MANKSVGKKYAPIKEENKHEFVGKLQNFLITRIDYILRFPLLKIPLKQLIEQLQMCGDYVKGLTMHRMKHSDVTFDIETRQVNLMKG